METWDSFFKPEVRNAGGKLVDKGIVQMARGSDTEIQCYIRSSPPLKVSFSMESFDSSEIQASCSCPSFKKGQLCKHIWAALSTLNDSNPDFLQGKTDIAAKSTAAQATSSAKTESPQQAEQKIKREQYAASQKERQNAYRKEQYQKQKAKLDAKKGKVSKKVSSTPDFPEDVQAALQYFSENGFELSEDLTSESISLARKQLSRIFHPDKGGSHSEITELNAYTETLLSFV